MSTTEQIGPRAESTSFSSAEPFSTAAVAEQYKRGKHCDEQRDARRSHELTCLYPQCISIDNACLRQGVEAGVEEDEEHWQQQKEDDCAYRRRILRLVVVFFAKDIRNLHKEVLAHILTPLVAGEVPHREGKNQTDDKNESDAGAEELGGGNRTGMRWYEHVHHREGTRGREHKVKHRLIRDTARHGKDDRKHHNEASVKEHGEAEQQRSDTQSKGRLLLTHH